MMLNFDTYDFRGIVRRSREPSITFFEECEPGSVEKGSQVQPSYVKERKKKPRKDLAQTNLPPNSHNLAVVGFSQTN